MRSFSPIILTVAAAAVLSSCGGRTSISGNIKDYKGTKEFDAKCTYTK